MGIKNFLIVFFSVIALIIVLIVVLYFYAQKPIEQNSQNSLLSLNVKTIANKEQISTGIQVIMQDNSVYLNTSTTKDDYKLIQIPPNTTFTIYTFNLGNQSFYTSKIDLNSFDKSTLRADVNLIPKGNISIVQYQSFLDTNPNPFAISILSNGTTHLSEICFRWTYNFIDVSLPNYLQIDVPKRLQNKVDRCYNIAQNYTKRLDLAVSFRSNDLQPSDNILIYILDSDIQKGGNYDVSNEVGNYSGIPDVIYDLR
jgi:hypothetical protein